MSEDEYKALKEEFEVMSKAYRDCGVGPTAILSKLSDIILRYERSMIKAGSIKQTLKETP